MNNTPSPALSEVPAIDDLDLRRQMLAETCKSLLSQKCRGKNKPQDVLAARRLAEVQRAMAKLAPRVRQTLSGLLAGEGEKQIAKQLGVSPHTIHVYVKTLYIHFDVCTRGELLALFVRQ